MKYLLSVYLLFIFRALNSTLTFEAAEGGFKDCTELLCLCGDVYNGIKIARNKNVYYKPEFHEFYPKLKEFIDKHPEYQNQSKSNKVSIMECFVNSPNMPSVSFLIRQNTNYQLTSTLKV